ncbi:MAG: response regulator transcription factor [bacterium]|nr:response regulator transcription factor [bacterium]
MKKLAIIEDNNKLRGELATFFSNNHFEVACVTEFDQIVSEVLRIHPDLILLDLNLPNTDGLYVCQELRKVSDLPIVIMTARNTEVDELISMTYGADDFVTKPFNTQILLARVNNIFRRMEKSSKNQIAMDGFLFDLAKSCIIVKDQEIELTKNEMKILSILIENKGAIVSRDTMISELWDSDMFVDDNTLTVNINRLRKKLEEAGLKQVIETKRGQGYIIR